MSESMPMQSLFRKDKMIKFMRLTQFIASEFSKDPNTKVGAYILDGSDFSPYSFGYNGLPRGCDDHDQKRMERPEKYFWFSHAERNAIDNAAKIGIPLKGGWMVVTMLPCMDCARSIVQSGIKGVVTMIPSEELKSRWNDHFSRTESLFKECGVELHYLSLNDLDVDPKKIESS
jgi:dCMP deaminase